MAPILSFLISSGSKKKEPRCVCLSEAKASHLHKMWTEVSPSVPHLLQVGLLLSPIVYRCLLKVLCPVSRPITILDFVLLKDNNWALVVRSGPEINSQACLCVLQGPCHNTRWCFSIQRFIFLLMFCLETPKKSSGPTNRWTEPSLVSLSAISTVIHVVHSLCYGLSVFIFWMLAFDTYKWCKTGDFEWKTDKCIWNVSFHFYINVHAMAEITWTESKIWRTTTNRCHALNHVTCGLLKARHPTLVRLFWGGVIS
jgi:hypothetical protein